MKDRVINDSTERITQGYEKGVHNGVDLGWRTDESQNIVYPNCAGVVYATLDNIPNGSEEGGGWGNYVFIKHPNGIFSRYAHLQNGIKVSVNQSVDENTPLGIIGDSGRAYGRHLHFEPSYSASSVDRFDPTPYLSKPIYEDNSKIHYRAYIRNQGWTAWTPLGTPVSCIGTGNRIETLQIDAPFKITAKAHLQDYGWLIYDKIDKNTNIGEADKRLDCISLKGDFRYSVYVEGFGWTCWTNADGISTLGSVGQCYNIQGFMIG